MLAASDEDLARWRGQIPEFSSASGTGRLTVTFKIWSDGISLKARFRNNDDDTRDGRAPQCAILLG